MKAWLLLLELLRLAATIEAMNALRWTQLPDRDRLALVRLIAMLPSTKLAAELRALDASHAEHGAGAGQRPAEGAEVYLRAEVLRTMRALGGGR
jgi:hypothetical protein